MKQSNEKTTAVYCRTARKNSMEISLQEKTVKSTLNQNNKIYSDNGYSGLDFNRPAFQNLLSDMEQGKVDTIVLTSLCRISRNYLLTGKFLELCSQKQISVCILERLGAIQ